jgi:hypothetical protein
MPHALFTSVGKTANDITIRPWRPLEWRPPRGRRGYGVTIHDTTPQTSNGQPSAARPVQVAILVSLIWLVYTLASIHLEFEPGDSLLLLGDAERNGYLSLLSKPSVYTPGVFEDTFMYRPLPSVVSRFWLTLFGLATVPWRLLHCAILLSCLLALARIGLALRLTVSAVAAAMLYLLAVPFTANSFHWWADMPSAVISACFLWMIALLLRPASATSRLSMYVLLPALSLTCKESGLVLCALAFVIAVARGERRWVPAPLIVGLVFLTIRRLIVGSLTIPIRFGSSSGFLFGFYDNSELDRLFGDRLAVFYAYNVTAQFFRIFMGQPRDGQILLSARALVFLAALAAQLAAIALHLRRDGRWGRLPGLVLLAIALDSLLSRRSAGDVVQSPASVFVVMFTAQSAVIAWYLWRHGRRATLPWLLVVAIALNSIVSYNYARDRVLNISACAYAVLLALSLTALERHPLPSLRTQDWGHVLRRVAVLGVIAFWGAQFGFHLLRLQRLQRERVGIYRSGEMPADVAFYAPITKSVFLQIQAKYRR